MNEIKEDFVNLETAKLLRDNGFDEYCDYEYGIPDISSEKYVLQKFFKSIKNSELIDEAYTAPTLQRTLKWIRREYKIHIISTPEYGDVEYMPGEWQEEFLGWKYTLIPIEGKSPVMHPAIYAQTPESSLEAAIQYCLTYLNK